MRSSYIDCQSTSRPLDDAYGPRLRCSVGCVIMVVALNVREVGSRGSDDMSDMMIMVCKTNQNFAELIILNGTGKCQIEARRRNVGRNTTDRLRRPRNVRRCSITHR